MDIKSLPKKSTKHTTQKQAPVGAIRNGKIKVMNGDTGKVSWRQGRKGFARDWDGEPIARNYNRSGMKTQPKHSPKSGKKSKSKTHMGDRQGAYVGDE